MTQTTTRTLTTRKAAQGKQLLAMLRNAGICAQEVTRNRRTGVYSVRFGSPNVTSFYAEGTDPARTWADRITDRFYVEIVDCYDSVAEWRPNKPVLFATVFLRWKEGGEGLPSNES